MQKKGIYIVSINNRGSVFIVPVDMNNVEQLMSLQFITGRTRHEVFPNIQAAVVEFLRPIYRRICGK